MSAVDALSVSKSCISLAEVGSCGTWGGYISVEVSSLVKLLDSEGDSILDVSCDKASSCLSFV